MVPEQLASQPTARPTEHLQAFEAALQDQLLNDPEKAVGFISVPSICPSNHASTSSGLVRRRCHLCQDAVRSGCCRARAPWANDARAAQLISPCHCLQSCDGLQEPERIVVHRGCLDALRASVSDARAFTHCADCGYAYCLKLAADVPEELQVRARRRRRHLRRVTGNFALWALVTQACILGTALLIRALDCSGAIPSWLAGASDVGGYWEGLRDYAGGYYFVAALCCVTVAGSFVLLYNLVQCCRRCASMDPLRGDACYACDCHEAGLRCCEACGRGCLIAGTEGWTPECGACCASDCSECCVVIVVVAVVVLVLCLLAGVIWLLVASVVSLQHVWKEFLRLRELRRMATDYVVMDLATFPSSGAPSFTTSLSQMSSCASRVSAKVPRSHSLLCSENELDAPSQQDMENSRRTGAIRDAFLEQLEAHDGATFLLAPITQQSVQSLLLQDLEAIRGSRRRAAATF